MNSEIEKCTECGCKEINHSVRRGEITCTGCGLVLGEKELVDLKKGLKLQVWEKSYGPLRVPWTHQKDFITEIGSSFIERDAKRKKLTPKVRTDVYRWKKIQRSAAKGERSFDLGLAIFRKIARQIPMPDNVKGDAAKLVKIAIKKKLTRGRTYEWFAAASIIISHRIHHRPISFKEVLKKIPKVAKKHITKCCQLLMEEAQIKVIPCKPEGHILKICGKLNVRVKVELEALEISKRFQQIKNTSGKDPLGIAAASVYLASESYHRKNPQEYEKFTQSQISLIAGVTEVTLRTRFKEMKEALSLLI